MYLQYTNPAAFPPLQHSSRIMAKEGWEVLFLGNGAHGADALEFSLHPNIRVKRMRYCAPGWRQKVHYVLFGLWAFAWVLRWKPHWIYASDPLSCPVALLLSFQPDLQVLYHEHDSPSSDFYCAPSTIKRFVMWSRKQLAQRATLCVVPNEQRAERFRREPFTRRPVFCVWNCPALEEVERSDRAGTQDQFVVFFHGSIVPVRLPATVLEALAKLPNQVVLHVAGYETTGHIGYVEALKKHAKQLGVDDRFKYLGVSPRRHSLLERCREANVGLAFTPEDVNEPAMTGASNKPFDYLACGLALLVSDLPEWRRMFVDPGYGLACDPFDPNSIAKALEWFLEHLTGTARMGSRGREKIATEWNYERQFAPVRAYMAEQR